MKRLSHQTDNPIYVSSFSQAVQRPIKMPCDVNFDY